MPRSYHLAMTHRLAYASFRVAGPYNLDPTVWTGYFGLVPTVCAYSKRNSIWFIESRTISDDLEPHIIELIERVGLPRTDLPDKLLEMDADADMFCYWDAEHVGSRSVKVNDDLMNILKASGVSLDIDVYE